MAVSVLTSGSIGVVVALEVAAVEGDLAQLVGRVDEHADQVGEDRDAVVALVEHGDRAVEEHLLVVARRLRPQHRHQRAHHRVPAAAGVGDHLRARLPREPVGGLERLARRRGCSSARGRGRAR